MNILLHLDKRNDNDLIAWLNSIEPKLHSYLIRQSMRHVKENNVPILITGQSNFVSNNTNNCMNQYNKLYERIQEKEPAIETNNDSVGKGMDLGTEHKLPIIPKSMPVISSGESIEDRKKRLQNKIRNLQ